MQTLNEEQICDYLSVGKIFEAILEDGSLEIGVQEYVPYLCTAIHAGHELRTDLADICLLNEEERYSEEDPYTDELIESFPITLVARDSRYEYDLNRPTDKCLYEEAWGKKVWRQPLTAEQLQVSCHKHSRYYYLLEALVAALNCRFGGCLAIDLHSYNWQIRQHKDAPIFHLSTAQLDLRNWSRLIKVLENGLAAIKLPNLETTVARNTVYKGRGFQAKFVRDRFLKTPLIPLEIKKIYMDERSGEVFPLVIESLKKGLHKAVLDTASYFSKYLGHSN